MIGGESIVPFVLYLCEPQQYATIKDPSFMLCCGTERVRRVIKKNGKKLYGLVILNLVFCLYCQINTLENLRFRIGILRGRRPT